MNLIRKLERKIGFLAIPNLMFIIVGIMFLVFMLQFITPQLNLTEWMVLDWDKVVHEGEVWRLITFLFVPFQSGPLFIIFILYFYYLIGSTLERHWGTFLFNIYYFIGTLSMIAVAALTQFASNTYLNLSLFFAFAILNPNFKVMLFFVIPTKLKYLAYLNGAFFLYYMIVGDRSIRLQILFSLLNLMLFFSKDLYYKIRNSWNQRHNRRNWKNLD